MNILRTSLILLFGFVLLSASVSAQTFKITPKPYTKGLNNPYKGFRDGISGTESGYGKWGVPEYHTIWRHYIPWSQIESNSTDGVQKIIDYCNKSWKGCEAANVRIIPRIYIDWDSNPGNENWPADLQKGDWTSAAFKDRVVKLIAKLGQAWDNDPRVAWIQTGIIGYWGEQESPVGIKDDGWAKRLGDAFSTAFKNKKLIVRNQHDWDPEGFKWGVYWDSFGHPGQRNGAWADIQNTNASGRYKSQIIEGEVAYNWGNNVFDPLYGYEPELTLNKYQFANNMTDVIRELHCTGLGWISSYMSINTELKNVVNVDSIKANASKMQNEFGYQFALSEFSCSSRTEPGSNLNFSFKVKNTASAPFYYKWPVAVVLIDEATRQIKEKIIVPDIDITTWLPGDNYNYQTRTYSTPAVLNQINATVKIPTGLATGKYLVGISILEPNSQSPGIFFAIENFFKESQTQPLARIGVGVDVSNNTLDGILFNDPQKDDLRYYSTTSGKTYSLTSSAAINGSISPSNGTYPENSNVTVTATPDAGYVFSSWGGDLAGSPNPATLSMTGNKNIWVNFKTVGSPKNLFTNGDFSTGDITGWNLAVGTPSVATASVINGECLVNIANDDGQHWHISLMQYNVSLIKGVQYTLKFKARAQDDRTISTKVQLNNDPWTSYQDGVVPITTTMNSYSVTWLQTETGSNNKIGFFLGAQGINNVWLDDVELIADGSATPYTITTSATNGTISLNPAGGSYDAGTSVSVTANPNTGYKFAGWSGDLSGTTNPGSVLMDKNMNITANFTLITYSLTVTALNGTVSMDPAGGAYKPGTVVTLTATPKAGYMFNGWSGDLTGSTNPATITFDKNKSVTANFKANIYNLVTSATYGSVSMSPAGGSYSAGTQVTLTASPNVGFVFNDWSGDISNSTNPVIVTMDANKNIMANFKRITYTLKTSATKGLIVLNPEGGTYNSGTVVNITAKPDSGYVFNGWSGDLSGNLNPTALFMNQNKNITALFRQILSSINVLGELSDQTKLGQNYPNPFLVKTTIPYQLHENSHVKLSIYNSLGQLVIILVDDQQSAGFHTVDWYAEGNNESQLTGIYIYQLETNKNSVQTRKLIITQ